MNIKKFMDEKPGTAFAIVAAAILFIGGGIFLFTKNDSKNPDSVTGLQVLGQQNFSFWLWAIVITAAIVVGIIAINKYLIKGGDSKAFGNWWIVMAIFIGVAWGKGCTDKANEGVTSPGHKVEKPVDDGREAAEEMIKK